MYPWTVEFNESSKPKGLNLDILVSSIQFLFQDGTETVAMFD